MSTRYDAVVVGAGHNGLVHAAYLARAGLRTLLLERRHLVGGAAITEELLPLIPGQDLSDTLAATGSSCLILYCPPKRV